jgi:biopolymer transport protein ExbB/TolQ
MTEGVYYVKANIDASDTLKGTWAQFEAQLRSHGSGDDQITAMETAFYMGAAQVFASIDTAAKVDMKTLSDRMGEIYRDVEEHMKRNMTGLKPQGSA